MNRELVKGSLLHWGAFVRPAVKVPGWPRCLLKGMGAWRFGTLAEPPKWTFILKAKASAKAELAATGVD